VHISGGPAGYITVRKIVTTAWLTDKERSEGLLGGVISDLGFWLEHNFSKSPCNAHLRVGLRLVPSDNGGGLRGDKSGF